MPFFGNLVNSIPGVGHAKGLIHYACNEKEAGDKAMRSANRSTIVLGAASAGAVAGPAGAAAAGAAAGACYDTATAIVSHGEHVNGVAKIIEKPGEIDSWVDAGIDVVSDGCCGVGISAINVAKEAGKTVAKQGAKEVGKTVAKRGAKEVGKTVAKQGAKEVGKTVAKQVAKEVLTSAAVAAVGVGMVENTVEALKIVRKDDQKGREDSPKPEQKETNEKSTQGGGRDPDDRRNGSQKGRKSRGNTSGNQEEQRRTDNSNQGGGRDPDDRRNGSEKKKECQGATMEQLQEFIRIVEEIAEIKETTRLSRNYSLVDALYKEFIMAAIPLMNDPTIQLRINDRGGLEIVSAIQRQSSGNFTSHSKFTLEGHSTGIR